MLSRSTSRPEAVASARKLVSAWPHAAPPSPLGWAESLTDVLEQYPLGVVVECVDPKIGLAREREFPPTVASVVDWCDRRLKYHRGMMKWGERIKPEPEFSDEHRKSMLERWAALLKGLLQKPEPSP